MPNALLKAAELDPPAASIGMAVFASGNGSYDLVTALNIMLDEVAKETTTRGDPDRAQPRASRHHRPCPARTRPRQI